MTDTNSFGYVKVIDGKIIVFYGDSSNPSVMSFDNTDIVKAIEEYPKLQAVNNEFKMIINTMRQDLDNNVKFNEKLKAENEELKKNLPDMTKWTIGLIIKELEEHPEYTASEILKRHKELYFGSPASKYLEELEESNKAHIEACGQWNEKYYKLTLEYDKTQQEINQLKQLKQDIKNLIKENEDRLIKHYGSLDDAKNTTTYRINETLQQLLKDDI